MRRVAFVLVGGLVALACGGSTTSVPDQTDTGHTSSSSGSSGTSASSSSGVTSSSSSSSSSSSGAVDAGAECKPACGTGRECCNGVCVNTFNDPFNCGKCGVKCTGDATLCDGTCKKPECGNGPQACTGDTTCCGDQCCNTGELCCASAGPVGGPPTCFKPTDQQKTCPQGCAPLCVSDREAKQNFQTVDPRTVLDEVARMPMSTWSYKDDPKGTRHLGPMAQDFKRELRLGGTDRSYDPIDAHGAALTSIQALYTMMKAQDARIKALEEENRALKQRRPADLAPSR